MLHWRLILGVLLVAMVFGLAWADFHSARPGLVMAPLAIIGALLSAGELVRLFEGNPDTPSPSRYLVVPGAVGTVLASCLPILWQIEDPASKPVALGVIGRIGWLTIGFAGSCLLVFSIEMLRYRQTGSATVRLALAIFGIAYAGGLMGFVVQLRMLSGGPWGEDGRWGMVALLSLMIAVKSGDIGAYFTGRLFGKHKLAPVLSPGKTWEGVAGGFALSTVATMAALGPLAEAMGCDSQREPSVWLAGCLAYALVVGAAGIAGDLAVSLLKRDAGLKNSSSWMPGFGGVLDLLDSILFAAPVAFLLWLARCVGP